MKTLALGFAAALIGTAAFAQTSPGQNPTSGGSSGSPSMSRPDSPSMSRDGNRGPASGQNRRGAAQSDTNSQPRDDSSVSVKHRSVSGTREEPSVTTTHRRTIRNVEIQQDEPTVVKRKVVKKRHPGKVVSKRKRGRHVVTSHGRRTVRRIETEEPSVSVSRRRTTAHQRGSVAVRGKARHSTDVSVSGSRQRTTSQSRSQSGETTRKPGSGPETTGSVGRAGASGSSHRSPQMAPQGSPKGASQRSPQGSQHGPAGASQ